MRILGAVLAGGTSTRFGSDKAQALFAGKPLIEHVVTALLPQVETLVISGRDWPPYARVDDLPAPGLGPLSGLCGALAHARLHGFDAVLCAPCDTLGLPSDLVARLSPAPAVARGQRGVGLWPATLATTLLARLASGGNRSLLSWVTASEAREVDCGTMHNINHPDDLG
jgi:molybdopterin-guanine dinucleotide biosynthesis protein A